MSSQITNNYTTIPTFFNLYVTRKLNNINEAKLFKKKYDDWSQLHYKTLKGMKVMIDV